MSQIDDVNFNPPPLPSQHNDEMDEVLSERGNNQHQQQQQQEFYQHQQPPYMFNPYQFNEPPHHIKKDIFTDVDKSVYIVIFIAFILGFFMGKTMQPVILRPM